MPYESEEIPDSNYLYRRIHKSQVDDQTGEPASSAFSNLGEGMSTDWEKYSTPEETRRRIDARHNPLDYGIVRLNAGNARGIENQEVKHTPKDYNRSHTDIIGNKTLKIRHKIKKVAEWICKPGENLL
jgi:hypothetical protein